MHFYTVAERAQHAATSENTCFFISRKQHNQFDSRCCKCSQHNQINFICSVFLCLVVLWVFAVVCCKIEEVVFLICRCFFYLQCVELSRPPYFTFYIYAFSRRFYPKWLTLHSSYSFTFDQLLLSLGIEPMILALLAPCSTIWATGKLYFPYF